MLRTKICDMLNIKYPLISAGMGPVSGAELAAAVSDADGLGVIGSWGLSPEDLRNEIEKVRSITSKPFGVDLIFPLTAKEILDVSEERIRAITGGRPVSERTINGVNYFSGVLGKLIEVVGEEGVPVIIAGLGNPMDFIPPSIRDKVVVGSLVGTVEQGRRLEAAGVDFVIAQGYDAGGHTGNIGTFSLVPQMVDAVKVPVLAAGGIMDARGVVAALVLGACGVLMGTRFIASPEASVHPAFREKLIQANDTATVVTKAFTGKPMRNLKNRFTSEWANKGSEILPFPLQFLVSNALDGPMQADVESNCTPAGQGSGMVKEVKSAREIVWEIMEGAEKILQDNILLGGK